ncbi:MAG: hypothetical protein ACYCQI_02985 [Gammaproteobacteria bacterium]
MRARTLLKKLTDHGLTIKINGDNVRLSPLRLVNDNVLTFVRVNKAKLLVALWEEHREKKQSLGHRVQVLRVLAQRYLEGNADTSLASKTIDAQVIEGCLDDALIQFNYDVEAVINFYKSLVSPPVISCKCGYQHPFCICGIIPTHTVVCENCEHFLPDIIGDGTGIGRCGLGIQGTQEYNGMLPLFRFAARTCQQYSKLMN